MDLFGLSVSLSDDGGTLAVGAYAEDSNAVGINGNGDNNFATNSGAVYVFIRNESGWTQQAYIKSSNAEAYDLFGYTVSLSADGNTLAVGAEEEDSNAVGINGNEADNSASASGAAYIFTRTGTTWSQQAYIKASNPGPADLFGESVSLSADGNVLAVGAVGEQSNATGVNGDQTDNTLFMAGATYIFVRNGTSWSQQAYLKASNTDEGDRFGRPVRINASGDVLAIGADGESSNATGINGDQADDSLSLAGAVYIFSRSGATWSQQAYVKASNTDEADLFGTALSLNAQGTVLAVGAEGESSDAVGLNGDQNNNNAFGAGAAYLFTRSGSTWSQQAYIKAANAKPESAFGSSVSLNSDGDILAIGAALENGNGIGINIDPDDSSATNAGAAYVFTRSGTTWSQQAYLKASNTNAEDRFGSVNLSGDGQTLAVGAWREASDANGINADQDDNSAAEAGAVYLY